MDASGPWSFAYSINFQIRQIPAQTNIFLLKKAYCCVGQDFWKKKKKNFPVWDLVTTGKQIDINFSSTRKILQNFEGHDH